MKNRTMTAHPTSTPQPSYKVMIVEDETDVRELLALHLAREGLTPVEHDNAEEAYSDFKKQPTELIILDWMLPGMSGLEFCKKIRGEIRSTVPILMLTARAEIDDKVSGLEIGADDYLTKPFEVREFVARVRSLLRRTQGLPASRSSMNPYKVGSLELNPQQTKAWLSGDEIALTPQEFRILKALMDHAGRTLSRADLIQLTQGDVSVVPRVIDTSMIGLRKKLGNEADRIETVRGFGYRFSSD